MKKGDGLMQIRSLSGCEKVRGRWERQTKRYSADSL